MSVTKIKKKENEGRKEGEGDRKRGTECNIMEEKKVTGVQSIMRNYLRINCKSVRAKKKRE